ncbi:MAG TPA: DUF4350 domain-containing protein [Gemmatimonas sp.]|nr:DUF4350 domain-containing protein [Gemmatimonas sp.]
MTAPATDSAVAARAPWYARPGLVISLLVLLFLVVVVFARTPVTGRSGDPRLSTLSSDPLGAKLLYELAGRIGWTVERHRNGALAMAAPDAGGNVGTVYAILDPTQPVTPEETGRVLSAVRGGSALLLVIGRGTRAFSDSLRIEPDTRGYDVISPRGAVRACTGAGGMRGFTREALWFGNAQLLPLKGRGIGGPGTDTLISVAERTTGRLVRPRAAMTGIPFGAGRIVVAADPDVFRNDALRECTYGLDVAAVAALDYLAAGAPVRRDRLVFDEVHQGRGTSGMTSVIRGYLTDSPSGRTVLQLAVAGFVLLLAAAPRVVPPRDDTRVERRSPLEHVDALSRAYLQVGATRTATHRLVRGLRRRVERGALRASRGNSPEDTFLGRVADVKPALAGDIATVRTALSRSVSTAEFRNVGQAIHRIEATLTKT